MLHLCNKMDYVLLVLVIVVYSFSFGLLGEHNFYRIHKGVHVTLTSDSLVFITQM